MATKRRDNDTQPERTRLIVSRETFKKQLTEAIEKGQELLKRIELIQYLSEVKAIENEYSAWNDLNSEILKASFNKAQNEYKHDYDSCTFGIGIDDYAAGRYRPNDPYYQLTVVIRNTEAKLEDLRQLLNKVDYIHSEVERKEPILQLVDNSDPLVNLHTTVRQVAGQLYADGHFRQAILDTYIALSTAVKDKSGLKTDNTPLMQSAFSPKNPTLIVSSDPDEQQGFMWLYSGAMMAIRNPKAHRLVVQTDRQRTLEWLYFASVLFRVLDETQNLPHQASSI